MASVQGQIEAVQRQVSSLSDAAQGIQRSLDGEINGMLRALVAGHAENRRALFALRRSPEYEAAFTDERPLVTITLTTTPGRTGLLLDRALPSALAQEYDPIEIVVVSDAAGEETRDAVRALGDERIRFFEQTHRVLHADPWLNFLTAQMLPRNYAHVQARGSWVLDLDDDDALRPGTAQALLDLARRERAEVTYGFA